MFPSLLSCNGGEDENSSWIGRDRVQVDKLCQLSTLVNSNGILVHKGLKIPPGARVGPGKRQGPSSERHCCLLCREIVNWLPRHYKSPSLPGYVYQEKIRKEFTVMKLLSLPFSGPSLGLAPPKSKFIYQPIRNPREVRLVKILPGARRAKVKCDLEHAFLDHDLPEYDALSYCWGDASQKVSVTCNEQSLEITKDLFTAILRFRHKDKTIRIWIDQLCIDQENIEERGNQVQLMRDIYSRALTTIVWLGGEADQSALAFKHMERLKKRLQPMLSNEVFDDAELSSKNDARFRDVAGWSALAALLRRPWFGRMWILQELAVSSFPIIICGQQQILWEDFWDLINGLKAIGTWSKVFATSSSDELSASVLFDRLSSVTKIKETVAKKKFIPLAEALKQSKWSLATDSRDKIYALLGICCETHGIIPDYARDAPELYCEVAKNLLFSHNSLCPSKKSGHHIMGILSEAESSDRKLLSPSWVPEWTAPSYHRFWSYTLDEAYKTSGACAFDAGYKAAGESIIKLSLCDDPILICLSGKVFDTIDLMTSVAPYIQDVNPNLVKHARSTLNMTERAVFSKLPLCNWVNESSLIAARCQRYPEGYPRENSYSRTLVGNTRPFVPHHERLANGKSVTSLVNGRHVSEEEMMSHYSHFRQFLNIICPSGVINTAPISRLSLMLNPLAYGFIAFWETMVNVAEGRRFFATLGGYMGLGPPGMRPGDVICVFLGGPVPWVIRQEGNEYVLIGECYIHGCMNGEVITTEHLPVQDIVLK